MAIDIYIKFGNLGSEWVESYSFRTLPFPIPATSQQIPAGFSNSDARVVLSNDRYYQDLYLMMVAGTILDRAVFVIRNTSNGPPVIICWFSCQNVIIDALSRREGNNSLTVDFGYDNIWFAPPVQPEKPERRPKLRRSLYGI